jgi:hypothetical protein
VRELDAPAGLVVVEAARSSDQPRLQGPAANRTPRR